MKKITFRQLIPVTIVSMTMVSMCYGQINDVNTPLHELKPDYPVPYDPPSEKEIKAVADRVYSYLDAVTPTKLVHKQTGQEPGDFSGIDSNTIMQPGDFRLTSYEWGVAYSGMLAVGEQTGDSRYTRNTPSIALIS